MKKINEKWRDEEHHGELLYLIYARKTLQLRSAVMEDWALLPTPEKVVWQLLAQDIAFKPADQHLVSY